MAQIVTSLLSENNLAMIWPELCRSTDHTKGWLPCVGSMIHPFVGGRFLLWWKLLQSPFTFGLP